jgi:hypothetical protein
MGRKIGSKNKTKNNNNNINTAKNKNVININVNSTTSTKKGKGRGRPRKTSDNTIKPGDNPPNSSSGYNSRPQYIPPPIMPIITPSQDGSMNLLSQFLTSKMLNDSNRTMNLPETTQLNYSRSSVEPSHTFNARESIIPRLPDTPQPKHQDIVNEIKPSIPPPPPPPPLKKNGPPIDSNFSHLSGQDAINAELKYLASDEGKAEKARKKAEAAAKRESKKLEKEAGPQQSTTDFLNMSFPTPKKDIVQMLTPQKEPMSSSIIPYKENTSLLDFVMGGTPQKQKTAQEIKHEKNVNRLKEIKKSTKTKHIFEYNDLKTEMTGQPNPNQNIGSSMINRAIKGKMARKELENKKEEKKVDAAAKKFKQIIKELKHVNY